MELSWNYPSTSMCRKLPRTLPNLFLFLPASEIQCWGLNIFRQISQNPSEFGACQVTLPPKKNKNTALAKPLATKESRSSTLKVNDLVSKIPFHHSGCRDAGQRQTSSEFPGQIHCEVFAVGMGCLKIFNGISNFRVRHGGFFQEMKSIDKIPHIPSQDKLHASTEATEECKMQGWWMIVFIVMLFPSTWCSRGLWRNHLVV